MRKPKKYHYIYKITMNDGKYYIGLHSTDNLEDGYFGSGKKLWHSIKKHGKDAHTKEIIEFLPSREELKRREAELVNEECIADPMCLNIALGGCGGWEHCNTQEAIEKRKWTLSIRGKAGGLATALRFVEDDTFREKIRTIRKNASKKGIEVFKQKYPNGTFIGKKHTDETKEKMREAKIGYGKGENNSQFGMMWITNEVESIKIKKDQPIPIGWRKGRKMRPTNV